MHGIPAAGVSTERRAAPGHELQKNPNIPGERFRPAASPGLPAAHLAETQLRGAQTGPSDDGRRRESRPSRGPCARETPSIRGSGQRRRRRRGASVPGLAAEGKQGGVRDVTYYAPES